MNIDTSVERLQQAGVFGQVGDASQFNLVVVSHQEFTTRRCNKDLAKHATRFVAHGDVVQVGLITREPTRAGHSLIKAGVNAPVGGDGGQ